MKKSILTVGIAMLFIVGSATFIGCGNSENHESDSHEHAEGEEHAHEEIAETTYYCPMKCEGEKTYAEEGSCPECGMDLVVLDEEGEH
ncbi:MAG: hypothetical protein COA97_12495 [Flavobacteriales bacterium]|nr:MAG: hypothetical protein COA97_12495 [Flavobacteriales bacterium]